MKIMSKLTIIALTSVAFVGCANKPKTYEGKATYPQVYPQTQNVLDIISNESQKAMMAAKQLATYQEAYNATLDYRQRNFETDQILVDYIGKPNDVLNSVAIRYGYRYIELGNPQDLPTVNYTNYWTTPNNLIVDVNAKIGNQGSVALDKSQKVITLIYPNTQPISGQ